MAKCKKCSSSNLKLEQRSKETNDILDAQQVALLCSVCGTFQKWCPKNERIGYIKNTSCITTVPCPHCGKPISLSK